MHKSDHNYFCGWAFPFPTTKGWGHIDKRRPALKGEIFTVRKRSLRQGHVFTSVCHSVHRGGERSAYRRGVYIRGRGGSASRGEGGLPTGGVCPTPTPELEKRAVRILLECFLVQGDFCQSLRNIQRCRIESISTQCQICRSTRTSFSNSAHR